MVITSEHRAEVYHSVIHLSGRALSVTQGPE